MSNIEGFEEIARWIRQHHEKLDGSGHYRGKIEEEIAFEAKIITVADIYQALTEDRPYQNNSRSYMEL